MTDTQIDLLKTASEWAKAEMFSSAFFVLFGLCFIATSAGFWQLGKTDLAKAYVTPFLVVGALLIIIGVGLVISNQMRLSHFPLAYQADGASFLASEIARVTKTMAGYERIVYRILPLLILTCSVLFLYFDKPIIRTSLIAMMALFIVIMVVDSNANKRLGIYKAKLLQIEQSS